MDRQHREGGAKTGSGQMATASDLERQRKQRLRMLQIETTDVIANDPYILRNHLGSFECRLCLTLHSTENSYLVHTSGKKHQTNLQKRKLREQKDLVANHPQEKTKVHKRVERIGQPGYKIVRQRDADTNQRSLLFELEFPELILNKSGKPKFRIMSSFEQRVEEPDPKYQYMLVAAEPYETVAFKIPNMELDFNEGKHFEAWDKESRKYTLQIAFKKK